MGGYDPWAVSLGGYVSRLQPGRRIVPARDCLHIKLEATNGQPLVGVPPLRHAALAVAAQNAIGSQLIRSFAAMNRPAGVIETDQDVNYSQIEGLRKSFNDAWRGVD